MQAISREDIAWAAGLFEGEGYFGINARHGQRTASVQMTDEDVVRRFHSVLGFGRVRGPLKPYQTARKMTWKWEASKYEHVQAFIAMVWPWLCERRKARARELLSYPEVGRGYRTDLIGRLRPTTHSKAVHVDVADGVPCRP